MTEAARIDAARDVIALQVSYDGTDFAGFARQEAQRTVQGRVEDALSVILRQQVETTGAGRTDAGVHALGQVMTFTATGNEPALPVLQRSLNGLCSPDIAVTAVRRVPPSFSARHSAVAREYRYRLSVGSVPPVFLARYSWWLKGCLDVDAMRRASRTLVGEHDFASFCVAESARGKNTRRGIDVLEFEEGFEMGERCLVVRVVGRAFLHSMVRIVLGTLVEVGKGRRPESWVAEVLAARDRGAAGPTAPACGLTLWRVSYPEELWP